MQALVLVPILSALLAPWHAAVTPSAMHGLDDFADVTYSPTGGLLSSHTYSCDGSVAAFGAGPPPERTMPTQLWGVPLAVGDGYTAVLDTKCDNAKTVDLARLGADGRVLRRLRLGARHDDDFQVALAPGPDGSVAVAWVDTARRKYRQWLRVGLYGTDRWVRKPVLVATRRFRPHRELVPPITELGLGVDGRGNVVAAFSDRRAIRWVEVPERGRVPAPVWFGPSQRIARLAVAVSPGGRAAVAWSTFRRGEHSTTPVRIYAALREPGQPFAQARLMEEQPEVDEYADEPGGFPDVALGADGRAVLTWDSLVGKRTFSYPLRVAVALPGRPFGAFTTLAREAVPGDVAVGADGRALVTWVNDRRVYVRVSTPDGRFGPRTTLGRGILPNASFAAGGRPRVQWVSGWDSAPTLHTATR